MEPEQSKSVMEPELDPSARIRSCARDFAMKWSSLLRDLSRSSNEGINLEQSIPVITIPVTTTGLDEETLEQSIENLNLNCNDVPESSDLGGTSEQRIPEQPIMIIPINDDEMEEETADEMKEQLPEQPIFILPSDDEKEEETEASQICHNPPVFKTGDCRICYEQEKASEADPIIQLGCDCKGDFSYGHVSCLTEWFGKRFLIHTIMNCELCRSPLGVYLEGIVRNELTDQVTASPQLPGIPYLLLLLRVPQADLDDLEVPLETPNFSGLPADTRIAIHEAFRRQEELQRAGERRRGENLMEAKLLAELYGEGPLMDNPDSRSERIDRRIDHEFILLNDVTSYRDRSRRFRDRAEPFARAFLPLDASAVILDDRPLSQFTAILEGQVIRVAIEPATGPDQNVEELLDDLGMHVDLIEDEDIEDEFLFLPSSMDVRDTPLLPPSMDDVDQGIPVTNNNNAASPGPNSAQPARREFTYGRFQRFLICDRI